MRRAFRIALLLAILASGFAPGAARATHDDSACSPAEDRPAYLCAGARTYRWATTAVTGKGLHIFVMGFEGTGVYAPSAATRIQGGCVLISISASYTEMCDLPFEVTFDPTLDTATIKGTTKNKRFGTIVVDLTINSASSPAEAFPASGTETAVGCGDAQLGSYLGRVERSSEANGTVRIGRTTLKAAYRPAAMVQSAATGGITEISLPCAAERLSDLPSWRFFECLGYYEEYGAGVCRSASHNNSVTVTGKSRTTTVRLMAAQTTPLAPSVPDPFWYIPPEGDPTWFSPSDIVSGSYSIVCISVGGRGFGFGMCEGGYPEEFLVEIDPALRTAHLKGEIPSPFEYFYGPRPLGMPSALDFGRVYVDVTLTPEGGAPKPVGRTYAAAYGSLCGAGTWNRNVSLQGDGGARGYIVFKRKHGSYRGNSAKPLPSTMQSSSDSVNFTTLSTPACSRYSEVEPA